MLPVCPILVFQLNWKHLSIMGIFDGTSVKWLGRGTVWRVDFRSSEDSSPLWVLHTKFSNKGKEWSQAS
jgi:hypothetical protein